MKLKTLAAAAAAAVMAAGPAWSAAHAVKVGMITTLSGGGAGLGIDVRDGFELALKQAGADNVALIVKDDTRKPDVAIAQTDELIQSDKVDIMTGIIWSNIALAVVPGAVRQGVFYLSPNAGPSQLAGKGCHQNYFNVSWQNDHLPEAGGAYANQAGYKNTFLMAPNYPAGKDMVKGYKRFFEGNASAEVYTKLGQTDYAAEIAQIRASDADSVFFFLPGGMGIAFMKQYAQSGVDKPLIGPAFSFDQGILQAVGAAAMGIKNTSHWNKDLDNAANKTFVAGFEEAYGRLPSLYASQGYDTANLILSALAKASPKDDPDGFREALRAADFASTRGNFKFGTNHHPIHDIYVREVVQEGDVFTNKLVSKVVEDHSDVYAADCKM